MKVTIAILAIVLLNYGVVTEDDFDKDKEECVNDLQLNWEEIVKLDKLDLPPDDNAEFNKFVECDSKKKGLMSDNGEVLFHGIESLLTSAPELQSLNKLLLSEYKNVIKVLINSCKSTPMVTDPGVNMIHVYTCLYGEFAKRKKSLA